MAAMVNNSPKSVLAALPQDHKIFLETASKLVYDKNKTRMRDLFNALDRDGSGSIDEDDFRHSDHQTQLLYDTLYNIIRQNFDFDGDNNIEPKEFFDGFVLMAWTKPHTKARAMVAGNLGDEFNEWVTRFNEALVNLMDQLNSFIANPG
jgi:EF-hand domain